jgi:arylsulfatase A-like enzyme
MSGRARRALLLSVAVAVAAAAACEMRRPASATRYPGKNVLVISIDTLRADHLASYGYSRVTSPTIDALAKRSVTFDRAFAPRGSTWPSLATMLTSLSPVNHKVRENGQYMHPGTPTIADTLHEKGYAARAFVSGTVCHMTRKIPAFEKIACGEDRYVTERAVNFLNTRDERPFFAWVHLIAPHGPFNPPAEYDKWSSPDYRGPIGREQLVLAQFIRNQKPMTDADRAQLYGLYDGEILFADALVKQILDALDQRGLRENTIVVFTADHGEELADHNGYLYHSCSVYDSVLRIPLMIALPDGARSGERVTEVVETEDIAPTLFELLQVPPLPGFEGESLLALMEGGARGGDDRMAWAEWYDKVSRNTIQTVRTADWRYVSNPHGLTPRCPPMGDYYKVAREELYDHTNDPLDQRNVATERPEVLQRFEKLAETRNAESSREAPQEIDKNLLEELRSFGYVE